MSHPYFKRLLKENKSLSSDDLKGIKILSQSDNLEQYEFEISIGNPIYEIQQYKLLVITGREYPVMPPKAKFLASPSKIKDEVKTYTIPIHPHIYSNGHICLNLLGDDWTPACSIESILISLQSMLNNNTQLERPVDDVKYTKYAGEFASKNGFVYHDDTV